MRNGLRKRAARAAAVLFLTLAMCTQALAAARAQLVRVFVYDNTLYTYVQLEGTDRPVTQVEAKIGGQTFYTSRRLETVRQAGFPVTYLLLLDNSNSMPDFREALTEFFSQMAENSGENTRFILATFGDQFQLIREDVPAEELAAQLDAVPFDERVTRLHSCMDSALDYLETLPRQGNEMRGMIVISDAVLYDPQERVTYDQLLERIQHSDVMLHSIGLGTDAAALESMGRLTEASGGLHQVLSEEIRPAAAADALFAAAGELLVTGFDLTGCTASGEDQEVSLTFASGGTLLCRGESTVDLPEGGETAAETSAAETETAETTPAETSAAEPETEDGETEAPAETETEAPAETETETPAETETEAPAAEAAGQNAAGAGSGPAPETGGGAELAAAAAAAVILAVLVAVLILHKRKKAGKAETAPEHLPAAPEPAAPAPEPAGIYMRLEVQEGVLASEQRQFVLQKPLTAGGASSCDIVLGTESAPAEVFRILQRNGAVCVEAGSSGVPVLVNGKPETGLKTLRSGDQISAAGVTLRLLF